MKHQSPTLLALALAGGVAFSAPAANAALYNFSQTGFDGGGTVSGSFEATDADSDGWITKPEVTAFSLSFSGDSIVPDFSQGLAELYILNYIAGTQFIGDEIDGALQEVIGTNWFASTGFSYDTGMGGSNGFGGTVENNSTNEISRSFDLARVVPAPAVFWLLASALPGFIGFSRRRKAMA